MPTLKSPKAAIIHSQAAMVNNMVSRSGMVVGSATTGSACMRPAVATSGTSRDLVTSVVGSAVDSALGVIVWIRGLGRAVVRATSIARNRSVTIGGVTAVIATPPVNPISMDRPATVLGCSISTRIRPASLRTLKSYGARNWTRKALIHRTPDRRLVS